MAKTPAAPAKRAFSFTSTPEFLDAIPEEALKQATPERANALPFKEMFSAAEEGILAGKVFVIDIPEAFWTDERGIADLATKKEGAGTYQRNKLRDQFKAWQKDDEAKRGLMIFVSRYRDGTQPDHVVKPEWGGTGKPEPHVRIWVRKAPA